MHKHLHKHVGREIGLTLVVGAFVAAWFGAGYTSLKASLTAAPMQYEAIVSQSVVDTDRDGVADQYDVRPLDR